MIKNCLEQWNKRRDAKQTSVPGSIKKPSETRIVATHNNTDSESSDIETGRTRNPPESRGRSAAPADMPSGSSSSVGSPIQPLFPPNRKPASSANESFTGNQYVQIQAETTNPTYPQFVSDIYVNSSLFNHGNAFALIPPSTYEQQLNAFINSDVASTGYQTATGQIKVTNGTRVENRIQAVNTREDDEEHVTGYPYTPNERIERIFGISPPWRS